MGRRVSYAVPNHKFSHKNAYLIPKQPLEMFCKKGVLRNIAKLTGKQLYQSLFFNKGLQLD